MIRALKSVTGDGLRAKAIRGTLLMIMSFGGQNVLRLAGNLILTRLLFPEAFGIMALVQVVLTGLAMFSDLGIRASIVQDARGSDPAFLNTAWTVQILRGTVLWLAACALGLPMAAFYDVPDLALMLPIAGLVALFSGFQATAMSTLNREMILGRLTLMNLSCQAAGLLVTIALAAAMQSVWALVWGGLVSPLLVAALSHVVLPGNRDRLALERDALGRLFGFGKYIFLATMAGFVLSQGDRAIIGKIASLEDLALYNIAFFLATVPVLLMRRLSETILFPLYRNRPPNENLKNWQDLARARLLLLGGLFLLSICLAVFGNGLVVLIYDARYEAAGKLLVILSLAQLPVIALGGYGASLLAAGQSGRFATLLIGSAALTVTLMLIGAETFGLIGVSVAPGLAAILYYPITALLVRETGAWMPRQDALFAVVSGLVTVGIFVLHGDLMTAALIRFGAP